MIDRRYFPAILHKVVANFRNSATKGGGEVACNQRNIGRTIEKKSLNITPIVSCLGDTSPEEETQELREVAAMGFLTLDVG